MQQLEVNTKAESGNLKFCENVKSKINTVVAYNTLSRIIKKNVLKIKYRKRIEFLSSLTRFLFDSYCQFN